jgi:hypothetical protein
MKLGKIGREDAHPLIADTPAARCRVEQARRCRAWVRLTGLTSSSVDAATSSTPTATKRSSSTVAPPSARPARSSPTWCRSASTLTRTGPWSCSSCSRTPGANSPIRRPADEALRQRRLWPCSETERLLVRHGLETIWRGKLYRESYAPGCWLTPSEPVPFRLTHDGETIGQVKAIAASGQWHHAAFMVDDPTPEVRERVKVGARVSLGAQSLRRYEDTEPNVVRHTLVRLEEIALVDDGEIAGFIGARITDLREVKPEPKPAALTLDAPAPVRSRRSRNERDLDELHRRIEAAGPDADVGAILVSMKLEKSGRWRLAV